MRHSGMSSPRSDGFRRLKNGHVILRHVGELLVRQPGVDLDEITVRVFEPQFVQRSFLPSRPRRFHDGRTEVAGPMVNVDHGRFVPDVDAEMTERVVVQGIAIGGYRNELELKILTDECGASMRPFAGLCREKPGIESRAAR